MADVEPRSKTQQRNSSNVRSRTSPPPNELDQRPPTKRARKAINCEPCRNSKLKCDRNRPCSSCVLRGTIALCYQDARGHESDLNLRPDDQNASRVDPMQEITRLKHSVSLLETFIIANHRNLPFKRPLDPPPSGPPSPLKKEPQDSDSVDRDINAPGMIGSKGHGGFYAGTTSVVTHLTMSDSRASDDPMDRHPSQEGLITDEITASTHEYDRDLLEVLPALETIDALVIYYFEYCNWIYRHVNQPAFTSAWSRFKSGSSPDRVVLATVCMIMAIAVHYLPHRDPLISHLADTHEELGKRFYDVMRTALDRHRAESRTYTLELVECLLIRSHYLNLSKTDSEEIWAIRAELVSMGLAMGLHRDPSRWRMNKELAERKRWAWWHILLLERWQAFMFGRPLAVASHHFDTQLPSVSPITPTNPPQLRLYAPNVALFRLAYVLGDIMDSAVSLRSVSYDTIMSHDKALANWMDTLPQELDLDEFRIARALASPDTVTRRLGVQSVIIRTSYYHIRFTLHRPYAASPSLSLNDKDKRDKPDKDTKDAAKTERQANSLDIAVGSADKLITLVDHARPDFLANASLAVPGHMSWGPFHVFSAAMFFSFQLISNPNQPGAGLFRANIKKALGTLELSRGQAVADRALDILGALQPLYEIGFADMEASEREGVKGHVLGLVKTLAFPYHDQSRSSRSGTGDSPHNYSGGSPSGYLSSPGGGYVAGSPNNGAIFGGSPNASARRNSVDYPPHAHAAQSRDVRGSYDGARFVDGASRAAPSSGASASTTTNANTYPDPPPPAPARNPYPPSGSGPGSGSASGSGNPYPAPPPPPPPPSQTQSYSDSVRSYPPPSDGKHLQAPYPDARPYPVQGSIGGNSSSYPYTYPTPVEEDSMWGASLSQAEWARFLDVMQRPTGERG
ncbi:fungal-specific transcription factor domain-containing protein [Suillus placidus]|uniref:Fungal-specific transcription factor domain-containing protein n=1 Tax=Suillus placidus TaxID=48579 RepID=A0A9P7D5Q1_9AGAM|nr:fungal-specific transcription factor domain-containing protein [Suillus placidus]